jgi:ATP-dependent helicase YprA (DUF1998 family)
MESAAHLQSDEASPAEQDSGEAIASLLRAPLGHRIWSSASGRRLRHIVYSLIGCPAVKAATYILVRREPDGTSSVLAVRRTRSAAPSLNLARIRRAGARLGANEVHLYQAARSDGERARIVSDLAEALSS